MTRTFRGKDLRAVWLLGLIALFLFADQNLMAPNLTQIADEFGFSAEQRDVKLGGHISLSFWLFGGVIALFIGYLTDRMGRRWLFGAVVLIGEIPCLLTGFAQTYEQLFWLRAATGIGIGGAMPLVYSLIGDYFPAAQRPRATAYIGLAMGLGIALGQFAAGFLGPDYGWRLPFIVVAAPNFVLGALFLITVKEPMRGQAEDSLDEWLASDPMSEQGYVYTGQISWSSYRALFRVPSNLLIFLQGALGTVPWGVFFVYLNDFLAQEKGYSVRSATAIVLFIGAASIAGSFVGGLWGNRLYNKNPALLPLLCGIATLVGVLPTAILLSYPSQIGVDDPALVPPLVIGMVAGFSVAITAPNVRAMLLDVNPPETRGSVFALYNLADDVGRGLGPFLISAMIVVAGRLWAFHVANALWIGCGLLLLAMTRTFPADETALRRTLPMRADKLPRAKVSRLRNPRARCTLSMRADKLPGGEDQ
ncbi:MAG: MFS transporter [Proteobacteria bacterium]|nr:MFS transporter [Pseudomonadota bacterium]